MGLIMDRNLESYIKVYDGWLDADKCDQTVSEMNTAEWHQHTFYNPQTAQYTNQSGNKELDVTYIHPTTMPKIMECVWYALDTYIRKENISGDWFLFSLPKTIGTRFSTELSISSGAAVPTILKKRSDVP